MPEFQLTGETREARALWGELSYFERGYIEAAAFCGLDDEEQQAQYGCHDAVPLEDFAPETIAAMRADCAAFLDKGASAILDTLPDTEEADAEEADAEERAGRDFWYTRNGHGVGYWEPGRWPAEAGAELDKLARTFCERCLYVGDDGKLYSE